jgi:hypothetical protein
MEQYSSHLAAAASGCPICKKPLNSLRADKIETFWRNRCGDSDCPGVLDYTVKYETPSIPPKQSRIVEKEILTPAPPVCDDWTFVSNLYEWMDKDGNVVSIKQLPDKEFVDSVWALLHANFSKVGTTLAWAKQLPTFGVAYAYPREVLAVGARDAKDKLEEFYENAEERGWITPASG